jgi:hypothetical protein
MLDLNFLFDLESRNYYKYQIIIIEIVGNIDVLYIILMKYI